MSVHDRWMDGKRRTEQYGIGRRWEVRWRDENGRQRKRRYETKRAADLHQADLLLRPDEHTADPTTVGTVWPDYIGSNRRKPKTRDNMRKMWNAHVRDEWEHVPVSEVTERAVDQWIGTISSQSAARQCLSILRGICAMRGRTIRPRTVASPRAEVHPLTDAEIQALADAAAPYSAVVWLLASTGMRFGEAAALDVGDVDVKRRRIRVRANAVQIGREVVIGTPKGGQGRDVPAPTWLLDMLDLDRPRTAVLLLDYHGGRWSSARWRVVWEKARAAAGMPGLHTHHLRHAAAMRAIERGVDLRTLQVMLGHSSLALTTDIYGRYAHDRLDEIGDLWDAPQERRNQ